MPDRLSEGGLDSPEQTMGSRAIQGVGLGERMNAGRVEGLVAVDVSETRDRPLIE